MKKRMKKWLGCAAAAIMVIAMGATGFARDFDTDQNLSFFGGQELQTSVYTRPVKLWETRYPLIR